MKKINILIFAVIMIYVGTAILIKTLGDSQVKIFRSTTGENSETQADLNSPQSNLNQAMEPNNKEVKPEIAGASTESNNSQGKTKELQPASSSSIDNDKEKENDSPLFLVKRVIDGDTIELDNGEKVRYIGIDTPETVHPNQTVECFGQEASDKNRELVEGKKVKLEKDITAKDKYGRLLRYVYLEDDTFLNLYLIQEGYATSYTYPPDVKYQEQFRQAEIEARNAKRGLWGKCSDDSDQESTASNQNQTDNDCLIKGNISSSGERIYHLPSQKYYNKTVIDESKGERWFCSEEEAQSAGWRKSKI